MKKVHFNKLSPDEKSDRFLSVLIGKTENKLSRDFLKHIQKVCNSNLQYEINVIKDPKLFSQFCIINNYTRYLGNHNECDYINRKTTTIVSSSNRIEFKIIDKYLYINEKYNKSEESGEVNFDTNKVLYFVIKQKVEDNSVEPSHININNKIYIYIPVGYKYVAK